MIDPYLVDQTVDELAVKIEDSTVSPEDGRSFQENLLDSMEACGADRAAFVRRLVRRIELSTRLNPQRKTYLSHQLIRQL